MSGSPECQGEAEVRPARVADVTDILEIVNEYAKDQVMLPRSPLAVFEHLRDYLVVEREGRILGCGALHVVWEDLGEIRSIAVRKEAKGEGLGRHLTEALIEEAEKLGLPRVFAFTYVPEFFSRLGFRVVEHSELPFKVFGDCLNCPKFNACDEIAVLRDLAEVGGPRPTRGPLSRPVPGLRPSPIPSPRRSEE